ncbi:unnamed protein product [Jaminaea pallidilutea]
MPVASTSKNTLSRADSQPGEAASRPTRGIKRRRPGHPTPLVERKPPVPKAEVKAEASAAAQSQGDDVRDSAEEEDDLQAKEQRLFDGFKEEYFEVVEQLPLEIHRSFALMRELELQIRSHTETVRHEAIVYRDWRKARRADKARDTGDGSAAVEAEAKDPMKAGTNPQKTTDSSALEAEALNLAPAPPVAADAGNDDEDTFSTPPRPVSSDDDRDEIEASAAVGGCNSGGIASKVPNPHSLPTSSLISVASADGRATNSLSQPAAREVQPSTYTRHPALTRISRAITSSIASSEEKVGLAVSVYQLVDRQCRRLDADLAKMTAAAAQESDAAGDPAVEATIATASARGNEVNGIPVRPGTRQSGISRSAGGVSGQDTKAPTAADRAGSLRGPRRKGQLAGDDDQAVAGAQEPSTGGIVPDMPYDPLEPTYCYCQQPSSGLMIGCDNDECSREWYHLECLERRGELGPSVMASLNDERKKWFCKECRESSGDGGDAAAAAGTQVERGGRRKRGRGSKLR